MEAGGPIYPLFSALCTWSGHD